MKLCVSPTDQVTIMDILKSCGLLNWHRYTMRVVVYQNNMTPDTNMSSCDDWGKPSLIGCMASRHVMFGLCSNKIRVFLQ